VKEYADIINSDTINDCHREERLLPDSPPEAETLPMISPATHCQEDPDSVWNS
jgi:hypothetical protein